MTQLSFLTDKFRVLTASIALLFGAVLVNPTQAFGDEALGRLEVSDLFIQPTFTAGEQHKGAFTLESSYLAATWTQSRLISATLKFGSNDLIGVPARYGPAPPAQLGFVEAYAQADSDFGRARLGLIPIPFGLEGGDAERRLRFPRSLLFQSRFVNIRDNGFSYHIANDGFFSDWAIHNGEGGQDLDNELWFTARWGWQDGDRFRVGVSGSAGSTSTKSTNPLGTSTSTNAGLDVNRGARVRVANGFLEWDLKPVKISLEANAGDTRQDENVIKFRESHADAEIKGGQHALYLLRYDTMDPRSDVSSDQITDISAGIAWRGEYDNSVLYLIATKRIQQDVAQDQHKAMLYWRITPIAQAAQPTL